MGTTADKLNKLLETKAAIKQAIIDKGVDISDEDTFASYPEKISSIQGGGDGVNWLDILTVGGTRGSYLFCECEYLTEVDLSNLDTSGMTSMAYMFRDCKRLERIDLSSFDTSNVTTMSYMFGACAALKSIDVSHFDTSSLINISAMFTNCTGLTSLDCSNFDLINFSGSASISGAFNYCTNLVDFYPPQNISQSMTVANSNALSHDSLIRILNNLMTVTTTKTLTLGATNLAKLTDEEKAIATDKGWTLK